MPSFASRKLIRFQHCDPAGLIFYPRAFVLGGEVIEDWFIEWSGETLHSFHKASGRSLPTVKTSCEFLQQVHLSDELDFSLFVRELGRCSVTISIVATRDGQACLKIDSTLVQVEGGAGTTFRPVPFSDDQRQRLLAYLSAGE